MLYPKNKENQLSPELFKNPTSEYRGTPFWAWNGRLSDEELKRQIDVFETMGFGGFHMHVRTGMSTNYLSDEFMSLIKCCAEKAEKEDEVNELEAAGLDYDELWYMDDYERREAIEEAGLDPDDFDF